MAVSGVNNFVVNRNEVITATLRLLQVIGIGETPQAEDIANCSQALNVMIKSWAKKGLPLWVTNELELPMVAGIGQYPIGPTAAYVQAVTITNGGTAYPDNGTVTFTGGTTGIVATGTYTAIGGVIQNVTVVSKGTAYTTLPTITFSGGGTGAIGVATLVGKTMSRPLRVIDAYYRDISNNDVQLTMISRQEYNMLGNKSSQGVPNQYYYDNLLDNGQLKVFNIPQNSEGKVLLQIHRQFFDMNSAADDFDFPQEWMQALKWGLACEVLAEYTVSMEMAPYYEQKAQMYIDECFNWSQEDASVYFTMGQ